MVSLILPKYCCRGSRPYFSSIQHFIVYLFRHSIWSKTLKWGKNVTLSSDPQKSAKHLASSPYRHWEHHCAFDNVQWLTDLGMGFRCSSRHYDCLCRNAYGFYGLKIIFWRSVVNCCIFGLWITLSEPIYDEYTQEVISGISKISGAICSLQRPAPLQKPAKHILACLYPPPHKGPIILQTLPTYSPARMHFAKGGKTIKLQILLNVSGTIKNVYCSIEILQLIFTKSTTYLVNRLLDCLLNVIYLFLWNFFFHNPYQPSSIVREC